MKENIDDTTWGLIAKHLDNELNNQEKVQLAQWLDEATENRKELKNAEKIWHLSDQREQRLFDTDYGWDAMKKRMDKSSQRKPFIKGLSLRYAMGIAASIILLAVISFTIYWIVGNTQYVNVVAENQKITKPIVLPDGSRVFLNAHSSLRYPKAFRSKTRNVELTGEAFFEVTKNPQQPFIIQTEKARVKVLGTTFNVLAYNKSDSVQVLVETGVVELSSRLTASAIRLTPGNTGVYYTQSNQLVLNKISDVNTIAWKTNVLVFRNANLDYVVQTLKKTFAQPISIEDGRLKNCRLNADFKNRDLGNILEAIKETLNLTVKKTDNGYVLTGPGC